MARKKTEKNSEKWKKTLAEDAPVRPPAGGAVLVWGEEKEAGVVPVKPAANGDPLGRIADFLEWSKPLLEKAFASLIPIALEVPLPKNPTFSVSETAKVLKLHPQTVGNYCRQEVFGRKMPNGKWRISKSEIEQWLKGQRMIHARRAL